MNNQIKIAKMAISKYKEIFGIGKYIFDRLLRLFRNC
jgi:hypothetical protein